MIDADLADLYGVTTGALNQAVKRNAERFPEDFMFRLTPEVETSRIPAGDTRKIPRDR
jgi:ORF6N domain